jgi:hypothetical protein
MEEMSSGGGCKKGKERGGQLYLSPFTQKADY